jgi:hypothetical protein
VDHGDLVRGNTDGSTSIPTRAVDAIPALLSTDKEQVTRVHCNLRGLIEAVRLRTATAKARLAEIEAMFAAVEGARRPQISTGWGRSPPVCPPPRLGEPEIRA